MSGYSVEHTKHGVLLRGEVPLDEMTTLMKSWDRQGYKLLAPGIATALGATMAVTRRESLKAWEEEIDKRAKRKGGGDPELEWLSGRDTGTSSLTIFSVLASTVGRRETVLAKLGPWGPSVPLDPDDFGRCHRLLKLFPKWRERLSEVAAAYPDWAALVESWSKVEALFEQEAPTGMAKKTYALMQKLVRP